MNKNWRSAKRIGFVVVAIALAALLFLVWGRKPSEPSRPESNTYYNIVVLLDLSDRIKTEKSPDQVMRDKKILSHIIDIFEGMVRKNLYLYSRDKLTIRIAAQEHSGYDPVIGEMADQLVLDAKRLAGAPAFKQSRKEILESLDKLYESAAQNPVFVGSDIWSFFRDSLENNLVVPDSDNKHRFRNILIVLTDGYIDFNRRAQQTRPHRGNRTSYMDVQQFRNLPNWKNRFDSKDFGLLQTGKDFNDKHLDVLVLEVKYRNLRDKEIIEAYWLKWLREMGVEKFQLVPSDDTSALTRDVIDAFVK